MDKKIAALMADMAECYRVCLDLTHRVLAEESLPDGDGLENLLRLRAEHLTRARAMERDLNLLTEDGSFDSIDPSGSDGPGLRTWLKTVRDLMTELREADRQLEGRLNSELHLTGNELQKIKKGQIIFKAYSPYRQARTLYLDRRS